MRLPRLPSAATSLASSTSSAMTSAEVSCWLAYFVISSVTRSEKTRWRTMLLRVSFTDSSLMSSRNASMARWALLASWVLSTKSTVRSARLSLWIGRRCPRSAGDGGGDYQRADGSLLGGPIGGPTLRSFLSLNLVCAAKLSIVARTAQATGQDGRGKTPSESCHAATIT